LCASKSQIAKAARERVAFMSAVWLDPPDCGTGLDFRKRHLKALAGGFAQVLNLLNLCEPGRTVKPATSRSTGGKSGRTIQAQGEGLRAHREAFGGTRGRG
jgi:hypothetical protein